MAIGLKTIDARTDVWSLGVVLFERSGRGLELTPSGLELVGYVRAMAEAANELSLASTGQSQVLEGTVCVSTSEIYAAFLLPAVLDELRDTHPGITIEIVATNATSDLKRREADIALRSYRPTQPELVAKKIRTAEAGLYASESYLNTLGAVEEPEQLASAHFIGFDQSSALRNALVALGLPVTASSFPLLSSSHLVQWELVKRGLGIGIIDTHVGDAEEGVARVLADQVRMEFPVWLVAHRELQTSRRIRVVYDLLAQRLGD